MADTHDNRATVRLGGDEFVIVASKLAERIYGDRFRDDVAALGPSQTVVPGAGGDAAHVAYTGRLKLDVAVSAAAPVGRTMEVPTQVVAAAWAMARAAGSTDLAWDEWEVRWWSLPSSAAEDVALWEAVCVDLAERAFFRDLGGQSHARQPDEGGPEGGRRADAADGGGDEVARAG